MKRETSHIADELEDRLVSFSARIIELSSKLPRTPQGKHISAQILKSGTSTAANYGEARGAESRADFIHKLRIVLKELNETAIWLRVIQKSSLFSPDKIIAILAENQELARIFAASVRTARGSKNE
jgi:four helix bundle protein